jgi:hypothetical protein
MPTYYIAYIAWFVSKNEATTYYIIDNLRIFPLPALYGLYVVFWERSNNILYWYIVCRFLKRGTTTYYTDIWYIASWFVENELNYIIFYCNVLRVCWERSNNILYYLYKDLPIPVLYTVYVVSWERSNNILLYLLIAYKNQMSIDLDIIFPLDPIDR